MKKLLLIAILVITSVASGGEANARKTQSFSLYISNGGINEPLLDEVLMSLDGEEVPCKILSNERIYICSFPINHIIGQQKISVIARGKPGATLNYTYDKDQHFPKKAILGTQGEYKIKLLVNLDVSVKPYIE